jgi:hypothetical protein
MKPNLPVLLLALGSLGLVGSFFCTNFLRDTSQVPPAAVPSSIIERQSDGAPDVLFTAPARNEERLAQGTPKDLVMARAIEAGATDFSLAQSILSEVYSGAELEHQMDMVLMKLVSDDLSMSQDGFASIGNRTVRDKLLKGVLSMLKDLDPTLLVATIQNQSAEASHTKALHTLTTALSRRGNTVNASEIVQKMPKGELKLDALRTVVGTRAAQDPLGTIEWIKSFDPEEQRIAESEIAQVITTSSPQESLSH